MPATTHSATFTWPGNSANTVFVTGAWDNWSGNSHALEKQSDGGFIGHVDLPFGQTYSYKYVVDGGAFRSASIGWGAGLMTCETRNDRRYTNDHN